MKKKVTFHENPHSAAAKRISLSDTGLSNHNDNQKIIKQNRPRSEDDNQKTQNSDPSPKMNATRNIEGPVLMSYARYAAQWLEKNKKTIPESFQSEYCDDMNMDQMLNSLQYLRERERRAHPVASL